jgi:hypothetical protein
MVIKCVVSVVTMKLCIIYLSIATMLNSSGE